MSIPVMLFPILSTHISAYTHIDTHTYIHSTKSDADDPLQINYCYDLFYFYFYFIFYFNYFILFPQVRDKACLSVCLAVVANFLSHLPSTLDLPQRLLLYCILELISLNINLPSSSCLSILSSLLPSTSSKTASILSVLYNPLATVSSFLRL